MYPKVSGKILQYMGDHSARSILRCQVKAYNTRGTMVKLTVHGGIMVLGVH